MPELRRPHHRTIAALLRSLDAQFLLEARCFFGGGTCLALMLDEFRESRDVDFLCADRAGFRALRETVSEGSLGRIMRKAWPLAREVRADRDAIRTFVAADDLRIKLEIIREGRIDLSGALDRRFGVPTIDLDCLVAEMLLANADRGLDDSTQSRDLVDLAFLAARHGRKRMRPGLELAETAYGSAIRRGLQQALNGLAARRGRLSACARALGVEDAATLRRGISMLRALCARGRGSP